MYQKLTRAAALVAILLLVQCVDPYSRSFEYEDTLLTVEGFVTDDGPIRITLQNTRSTKSTSFLQAVGGAKIEVRAKQGPVIPLRETAAGVYESAPDFRGKAGETYSLYFVLPDGRKYESSAELLLPLRGRASYTTEFVPRTQVAFENFGQKTMSAIEVKADFDDPADERNYYYWESRLFEFQTICLTCINSSLNPRAGQCGTPTPSAPSIIRDYQCDGDCWEILGDPRITAFSDVFINGNQVRGLLVRQVPFYDERGGLLELSQYNLSIGAFRYFDLLRRQLETSGTFVDSPPAPPIGNIRNVDNPKELVSGYFGAGGKNIQRIWINRRGFPSPIIIPLLGREPAISAAFGFSPPCRLSTTRTPNKPIGWQ
ncbi:DUF4249 domain-containing protein [Arundinibacter roseus]|uniref:DUF4249 domain-containing protein n=1 Tax=Arundinibacter roseus TaxID=2070510 RepID=A0A4V2X8M1_9BACT|nr:DUF4249 domain-containing protein [Arundinibacter roseus]TDB60415.1 DUF4249 domain-containing protein [Arundinibacter roseus]